MSFLGKFASRLWTREKPDGKSGWGAGRYLLVGALVTGGALWFMVNFSRNGAGSRSSSFLGTNKPPANPATKEIQLGEVAKAAQEARTVDIKPEKKESLAGSSVGMQVGQAQAGVRTKEGNSSSFFGGAPASFETAPTPGTGNTAPNDSIFTALTRSDQADTTDGRPANTEDGSLSSKIDSKSLRPSFKDPTVGGPQAAAGPIQTQLPPIETLVAKNTKQAIAPGTPGGVTRENSPNQQTVMPATHWLPRGEIIPVYILKTVETGNLPTLIELGVAKNVWFNGKLVLPFGTRFTATAGVGVRDRITMSVDALRRRDGLEIAASGLVLGDDQATGVRAYYIPPPTWVQVAPYVGSFATAFADIVKTQANYASLRVGNVEVSNTPPPAAQQAQQAAVAATSQALGDFIKQQVSDVQARYQSYLMVPAGTTAYVQLTRNTDLSALWDDQPRGEARVVGSPQISSTEDAYAKKAAGDAAGSSARSYFDQLLSQTSAPTTRAAAPATVQSSTGPSSSSPAVQPQIADAFSGK